MFPWGIEVEHWLKTGLMETLQSKMLQQRYATGS